MPSFLNANGRIQHYRLRRGCSGRAVVFANSLGTDLRIWDDVIGLLPSELPVLAYDKSGHGLSEAGAETIEDFGADLESLMDALGIRDALVCGVSVGGMIAQALAASRADLVAGLILANTGYRIGTKESWAERMTALDAHGLEPMADGIIERWFSPRFRSGARDLVAGYRMMLTRTPVSGYRSLCDAIRNADLTEDTGRLTCPTLCVAGSDDLATPPEIVEGLAALIPGARTVCYNGVGHLPCIEAPSRLAKDILAHLEKLA